MRARFLLSEYYAEINQLDSSDYYYRSIYDDCNTVHFRPFYDCMVAVGIANNLILRNMHCEAMPILKRWLPEVIKERSRTNIFDAYIAICKCYLADNKYPQAKETIDFHK